MATEQVCNLAGGTCGTGGWTGPLPGDPDNNVILRASTTYAGILVNWMYPTTNPHAVAHTLLYRATEGSFEQATQIAVVAGSVYHDILTVNTSTEYFYWITIVSVNGTVGDLIGPAVGVAVPLKTQTLGALTGEIDEGVLAQSLKNQIDKITLNYSSLVTEIADRIQGDDALSEALAAVQSGLDEALSFVHEEILLRKDGDNALASQLNTVAALNQANAAAILEERTARVDADSAMATSLSLVTAAAEANEAAVLQEATARATADTALANQITTVQTALGSNIASVQTSMQSQLNAVTGELDAIYTAKVDVNGLIGGFGIYGTATSVEAGFDVDRFWVGRTTNKLKPFVIEGSTVYMNNAVIKNASIDTLKIANNAITIPLSFSGGSNAYIPSGTLYYQGASSWNYMDSGRVTAILSTVIGGGSLTNCHMVVRLQLQGGGAIDILNRSVTVYGDSQTETVAGDVAVPHAGVWRVEVFIGNDWSSGGYYLQYFSCTAFGTKK